ncbi:MAG: hypothetical protein J6O73_06370, partial [Lachnospiraceae bacterium]|nr:hypothetical protein [Lachnospiraceae bacterium]
LFYLIGNCSAIPYGKKPSGGCALARKEDVAIATALGASVLQAERFFMIPVEKKPKIRYN